VGWNDNDLIPLKDIRQIMEKLHPVSWWEVEQFLFPLHPSGIKDFREWWGGLTLVLNTGGFWAAIFEPRMLDVIVHVFLEYPRGQDPMAFREHLRTVALDGVGFLVELSCANYEPKHGLTPHLRAIHGPSAAIAIRVTPPTVWSPPAS